MIRTDKDHAHRKKTKHIRLKFSVVLDYGKDGPYSTLPTPPVKIPFTGQPVAFEVTGLQVYQGEKGQEILTKTIEIKEK